MNEKAIQKISSMLPKNPIVSVDVGQHECWSAQSLHLKGQKGRILIGGGYGCMGCGLPWAIGGSVSLKAEGKDNTVYCIVGDGGLQMNIQEFETVAREKLPIKILVMNNKVLGKIWETQHKQHGGRFAETAESGGYTVPDFEKVAQAYGIKAVTLSSYKELDKYNGWLQDKEPCLLNIMLPIGTELSPKIDFVTGIMKPDVSMNVKKQIIEILGGSLS